MITPGLPLRWLCGCGLADLRCKQHGSIPSSWSDTVLHRYHCPVSTCSKICDGDHDNTRDISCPWPQGEPDVVNSTSCGHEWEEYHSELRQAGREGIVEGRRQAGSREMYPYSNSQAGDRGLDEDSEQADGRGLNDSKQTGSRRVDKTSTYVDSGGAEVEVGNEASSERRACSNSTARMEVTRQTCLAIHDTLHNNCSTEKSDAYADNQLLDKEIGEAAVGGKAAEAGPLRTKLLEAETEYTVATAVSCRTVTPASEPAHQQRQAFSCFVSESNKTSDVRSSAHQSLPVKICTETGASKTDLFTRFVKEGEDVVLPYKIVRSHTPTRGADTHITDSANSEEEDCVYNIFMSEKFQNEDQEAGDGDSSGCRPQAGSLASSTELQGQDQSSALSDSLKEVLKEKLVFEDCYDDFERSSRATVHPLCKSGSRRQLDAVPFSSLCQPMPFTYVKGRHIRGFQLPRISEPCSPRELSMTKQAPQVKDPGWKFTQNTNCARCGFSKSQTCYMETDTKSFSQSDLPNAGRAEARCQADKCSSSMSAVDTRQAACSAVEQWEVTDGQSIRETRFKVAADYDSDQFENKMNLVHAGCDIKTFNDIILASSANTAVPCGHSENGRLVRSSVRLANDASLQSEGGAVTSATAGCEGQSHEGQSPLFTFLTASGSQTGLWNARGGDARSMTVLTTDQGSNGKQHGFSESDGRPRQHWASALLPRAPTRHRGFSHKHSTNTGNGLHRHPASAYPPQNSIPARWSSLAVTMLGMQAILTRRPGKSKYRPSELRDFTVKSFKDLQAGIDRDTCDQTSSHRYAYGQMERHKDTYGQTETLVARYRPSELGEVRSCRDRQADIDQGPCGQIEDHRGSNGQADLHRDIYGQIEHHRDTSGQAERHRNTFGQIEHHRDTTGQAERFRDTYGQTEGHGDTDGQMGCHRDPCGQRERHRDTCGQTECHKNICGQREHHKSTGGQTERHRDICGQTERHRDICGQKERHRDTYSQKERHRDSFSQRERQRNIYGQRDHHRDTGGQTKCYRDTGGQRERHRNTGGGQREHHRDTGGGQRERHRDTGGGQRERHRDTGGGQREHHRDTGGGQREHHRDTGGGQRERHKDTGGGQREHHKDTGGGQREHHKDTGGGQRECHRDTGGGQRERHRDTGGGQRERHRDTGGGQREHHRDTGGGQRERHRDTGGQTECHGDTGSQRERHRETGGWRERRLSSAGETGKDKPQANSDDDTHSQESCFLAVYGNSIKGEHTRSAWVTFSQDTCPLAVYERKIQETLQTASGGDTLSLGTYPFAEDKEDEQMDNGENTFGQVACPVTEQVGGADGQMDRDDVICSQVCPVVQPVDIGTESPQTDSDENKGQRDSGFHTHGGVIDASAGHFGVSKEAVHTDSDGVTENQSSPSSSHGQGVMSVSISFPKPIPSTDKRYVPVLHRGKPQVEDKQQTTTGPFSTLNVSFSDCHFTSSRKLSSQHAAHRNRNRSAWLPSNNSVQQQQKCGPSLRLSSTRLPPPSFSVSSTCVPPASLGQSVLKGIRLHRPSSANHVNSNSGSSGSAADTSGSHPTVFRHSMRTVYIPSCSSSEVPNPVETSSDDNQCMADSSLTSVCTDNMPAGKAQCLPRHGENKKYIIENERQSDYLAVLQDGNIGQTHSDHSFSQVSGRQQSEDLHILGQTDLPSSPTIPEGSSKDQQLADMHETRMLITQAWAKEGGHMKVTSLQQQHPSLPLTTATHQRLRRHRSELHRKDVDTSSSSDQESSCSRSPRNHIRRRRKKVVASDHMLWVDTPTENREKTDVSHVAQGNKKKSVSFSLDNHAEHKHTPSSCDRKSIVKPVQEAAPPSSSNFLHFVKKSVLYDKMASSKPKKPMTYKPDIARPYFNVPSRKVSSDVTLSLKPTKRPISCYIKIPSGSDTPGTKNPKSLSPDESISTYATSDTKTSAKPVTVNTKLDRKSASTDTELPSTIVSANVSLPSRSGNKMFASEFKTDSKTVSTTDLYNADSLSADPKKSNQLKKPLSSDTIIHSKLEKKSVDFDLDHSKLQKTDSMLDTFASPVHEEKSDMYIVDARDVNESVTCKPDISSECEKGITACNTKTPSKLNENVCIYPTDTSSGCDADISAKHNKVLTDDTDNPLKGRKVFISNNTPVKHKKSITASTEASTKIKKTDTCNKSTSSQPSRNTVTQRKVVSSKHEEKTGRHIENITSQTTDTSAKQEVKADTHTTDTFSTPVKKTVTCKTDPSPRHERKAVTHAPTKHSQKVVRGDAIKSQKPVTKSSSVVDLSSKSIRKSYVKSVRRPASSNAKVSMSLKKSNISSADNTPLLKKSTLPDGDISEPLKNSIASNASISSKPVKKSVTNCGDIASKRMQKNNTMFPSTLKNKTTATSQERMQNDSESRRGSFMDIFHKLCTLDVDLSSKTMSFRSDDPVKNQMELFACNADPPEEPLIKPNPSSSGSQQHFTWKPALTCDKVACVNGDAGRTGKAQQTMGSSRQSSLSGQSASSCTSDSQPSQQGLPASGLIVVDREATRSVSEIRRSISSAAVAVSARPVSAETCSGDNSKAQIISLLTDKCHNSKEILLPTGANRIMYSTSDKASLGVDQSLNSSVRGGENAGGMSPKTNVHPVEGANSKTEVKQLKGSFSQKVVTDNSHKRVSVHSKRMLSGQKAQTGLRTTGPVNYLTKWQLEKSLLSPWSAGQISSGILSSVEKDSANCVAPIRSLQQESSGKNISKETSVGSAAQEKSMGNTPQQIVVRSCSQQRQSSARQSPFHNKRNSPQQTCLTSLSTESDRRKGGQLIHRPRRSFSLDTHWKPRQTSSPGRRVSSANPRRKRKRRSTRKKSGQGKRETEAEIKQDSRSHSWSGGDNPTDNNVSPSPPPCRRRPKARYPVLVISKQKNQEEQLRARMRSYNFCSMVGDAVSTCVERKDSSRQASDGDEVVAGEQKERKTASKKKNKKKKTKMKKKRSKIALKLKRRLAKTKSKTFLSKNEEPETWMSPNKMLRLSQSLIVHPTDGNGVTDMLDQLYLMSGSTTAIASHKHATFAKSARQDGIVAGQSKGGLEKHQHHPATVDAERQGLQWNNGSLKHFKQAWRPAHTPTRSYLAGSSAAASHEKKEEQVEVECLQYGYGDTVWSDQHDKTTAGQACPVTNPGKVSAPGAFQKARVLPTEVPILVLLPRRAHATAPLREFSHHGQNASNPSESSSGSQTVVPQFTAASSWYPTPTPRTHQARTVYSTSMSMYRQGACHAKTSSGSVNLASSSQLLQQQMDSRQRESDTVCSGRGPEHKGDIRLPDEEWGCRKTAGRGVFGKRETVEDVCTGDRETLRSVVTDGWETAGSVVTGGEETAESVVASSREREECARTGSRETLRNVVTYGRKTARSAVTDGRKTARSAVNGGEETAGSVVTGCRETAGGSTVTGDRETTGNVLTDVRETAGSAVIGGSKTAGGIVADSSTPRSPVFSTSMGWLVEEANQPTAIHTNDASCLGTLFDNGEYVSSTGSESTTGCISKVRYPNSPPASYRGEMVSSVPRLQLDTDSADSPDCVFHRQAAADVLEAEGVSVSPTPRFTVLDPALEMIQEMEGVFDSIIRGRKTDRSCTGDTQQSPQSVRTSADAPPPSNLTHGQSAQSANCSRQGQDDTQTWTPTGPDNCSPSPPAQVKRPGSKVNKQEILDVQQKANAIFPSRELVKTCVKHSHSDTVLVDRKLFEWYHVAAGSAHRGNTHTAAPASMDWQEVKGDAESDKVTKGDLAPPKSCWLCSWQQHSHTDHKPQEELGTQVSSRPSSCCTHRRHGQKVKTQPYSSLLASHVFSPSLEQQQQVHGPGQFFKYSPTMISRDKWNSTELQFLGDWARSRSLDKESKGERVSHRLSPQLHIGGEGLSPSGSQQCQTTFAERMHLLTECMKGASPVFGPQPEMQAPMTTLSANADFHGNQMLLPVTTRQTSGLKYQRPQSATERTCTLPLLAVVGRAFQNSPEADVSQVGAVRGQSQVFSDKHR